MAFFWSTAQSAFFRDGIGTVPPGAVPVTEEVHAALFHAVAQGASIETGPNGAPIAVFPPAPTEEEELAAMRASLWCTRAQGIAVLGPARWGAIRDVADDPETDWVTRTFILESQEWRRTSPTIDGFRTLLDVSGEELDALFVAARQLTI